MRIISGSARGRNLFSPRSLDIRPTSDRAREALFSILGKRVNGALIFDFYAGTGALGVEALSRGAQGAIFIDNSRTALEITHKNLGLLPESDQEGIIKLIKHDISKSLPLTQLRSLGSPQADIIFADPPYSKGLAERFVDQLSQTTLLHPNGIVVVEDRSCEIISPSTNKLVLIEKRVYGEASFWFFQPTPSTLE